MTLPGDAATIETDAVVIGAGPVGLFQVFELGLLGIRSQVVDSLPYPGGQCVELYADKPIYDIPATPVCTGRELIARLLAQIEPFDAPLHLGQQVERVGREPGGRWRVETSAGLRLRAATVIVAGGVGSFQPRRLKIDGIARFENSQVFYGTGAADAAPAGERTVVIGDDDAALDCAIRLAASVPGAGVTLMHRRDEFRANPATIARMRQLRDAGCLTFIAAQATGFDEVNGRLTGLRVLGADAVSRTLALDRLLVLTGLSPRLGPIAEWGLALERKQVVVNPATFETSEPGIFAVGDVNTYPGKRKLILCGFHEATLAAFAAAAIVFPDRPVHLEYTTTSPRLHRALGIAPATEP